MIVSRLTFSGVARSGYAKLCQHWIPVRRTTQQPLTTTLPLLALLIVLACRGDDAVAPMAGIRAPAARPMQVCNDPSCDRNINPYDTNISADVTVTTTAVLSTSTPVYDAETGQMTTSFAVTAPAEHLSLAAGYSYDGSTVVHDTFTDPSDPQTALSNQTSSISLAADNITVYAPNGQVTPAADGPTPEDNPMNLAGSTANLDVTAGVVADFDNSVTIGDNQNLIPSGSRATLVGGSSDRPAGIPGTVRLGGFSMNVESVTPNRLVVSEESGGPVGRGGLRHSSMSAGPSAGNGPGCRNMSCSRHTRTYEKHGEKWILAELRTVDDDESPGSMVHREHVLRFTNVKWFRNEANDAQRRHARPTSAWIPLQWNQATASASTSSLAIRGPSKLVADCGPDNPESCGGGSLPPGDVPIGTDPGCDLNITAHVNTVAAQVNILYAHGAWGDATEWCPMDPYLRTNFVVGNEIRHSLHAASLDEDQAADLEQRLQTDVANYPGPYVFITQSNGGLYSRLAAQQLNDPSLVRGIITNSAPHHGAPLARQGNAALVASLTVPTLLYGFGCNAIVHFICSRFAELTTTAETGLAALLTADLFREANPVTAELVPNSDLQNSLNSANEGYFLRAAVVNLSWDKWTEWRLWGDRKCPSNSTACTTGRQRVKMVDNAYHLYLKCAVVSGIFAIFHPSIGAITRACASGAAELKSFDLIYKRLSVGSARGDALVPEWSQRYPNVPDDDQFVVQDADSHLGVTNSTQLTGPGIRAALINAMHVNPAH